MIHLKVFLITILFIHSSLSFHDESIFEDDDIFAEGLPPLPNTNIMAPGTKWCGPGNTAANYNDLGTSRKADICCRAHDHCEEIMEPSISLHGLQNPDWFPRLKCSCEQAFINCLQAANTVTANILGRVYFGTRSLCFDRGYPIVHCKEYQRGTFRKRCIRYEVDKTQPKIWQFYELPFFSLESHLKKA